MPFVVDWKLNPYNIIENFYDAHPNDWQKKVETFFDEKLSDESELKKIPWLNETPYDSLLSSQIVKFRGMIQDMFDPEFYLDTYEIRGASGQTILKPGRYKDIAPVSNKEELILDSPRCVTQDRQIYYCISLPGENPWVKEVYNLECTLEKSPNSSSSSYQMKKRSLPDDDSNVSEVHNLERTSITEAHPGLNETSCPEDSKRLKDQSGDKSSKHIGGCKLSEKLHFPIPEMDGKACLVKTYNDSEFRLNEVVEAIGILSIDPSLGAVPHNEKNSNSHIPNISEEEILSHYPPASLVPRLHALRIKKMHHCNPLLRDPLSPGNIPSPAEMKELRETLRQILEIVLLGDSLATDYLIAHLISTVYHRQDVMALGKFSLNLSGITKDLQNQDYPQQLYQFLQTLVTHSHFLPLTLDTMNKSSFIPWKDYDINRLKTGLLQLPPHLHLFLDETQLSAGQLDASGVKNLTALGNLINWQKVDYDFRFHVLEQHSNIPVLIISEGKAMINSDCHVKLMPTSEDVNLSFSRAASMLTPEVLKQMRNYLTTCRLSNYDSLTGNMQRKVEDDFVTSHQQEHGMTADDLHNLLVLGRHLSLSCGEQELTSDVWKCVKILESERKERFN